MLQLIDMLQLSDPTLQYTAAKPPWAEGFFREIGVIVFRPTVADDFKHVEGQFALPMYRGALAKEELVKDVGQPTGVWDGTYKSTTLTPEKKEAATGTVEIRLMKTDLPIEPNSTFGFAHWIKWDFEPEEWLNEAEGYASGTRLRYVGVGIEDPPGAWPRLAAAWSNNVFTRVWELERHDLNKKQMIYQHGVCDSSTASVEQLGDKNA